MTNRDDSEQLAWDFDAPESDGSSAAVVADEGLASLTPANGITDYRIVNVVAEKEKGGSPRTECWFPLEMKPRTWLQMYALSKEGVSSESLEKYLAGISWVRGDGTMIVEASSLKEMAENRNTDLVQFFLLLFQLFILLLRMLKSLFRAL